MATALVTVWTQVSQDGGAAAAESRRETRLVLKRSIVGARVRHLVGRINGPC